MPIPRAEDVLQAGDHERSAENRLRCMRSSQVPPRRIFSDVNPGDITIVYREDYEPYRQQCSFDELLMVFLVVP
jgi:hypothetical protein